MLILLSKHLQVLTLHQSKFQTLILLVVHAMSWTIVCNREQEKIQNGSSILNGYTRWMFSFSRFQCWLILNPRMGHVLPQFHVLYDDDFTTVPYLRTAAVPPHWAELVEASYHLEVFTE